jgi:hypothetical protein
VSVCDLVTREVEALTALDLEGLRAEWRRRWGAAPKLRSPELLRRMIAWRIQASAYGGLDLETRRKLSGATAITPSGALQPGTRIVRQWQGRRIEVVVVDGGFAFNGAVYRSLSAIAQAVTGTKWNGPRFFGLRPEATS